MNDLQICNENGELINMQIDACNTAVDFFETVSKKGTRDFITQIGKLNLKAKEVQLKEHALQQQYEIAVLEENNKYRLAALDMQNRVDLANIKAESEYRQAELAGKIRLASETIAAQKEIRIEEEKTRQLRIQEQSKLLQKILEVVQDAHNKELESNEAKLKFCMDFFYPQIEVFNQEIKVLNEQHDSSENQEVRSLALSQISKLERARDEINDKVERIMSKLEASERLSKLEFNDSIRRLII